MRWKRNGWRRDGGIWDAGIWDDPGAFPSPGMRRGRIPGWPPLHRLPFVFPPPALVPKELPEKTLGNHGNHPLPPEFGQEKNRKNAGKRRGPFPFPMESPEIPRPHLDWGKKVCAGLTPDKNSELSPFPNTSSPDSQSWEFREKPLTGIKPQGKGWRMWETPRGVPMDGFPWGGDTALVQVGFSHSKSREKDRRSQQGFPDP